MKCSGILVIGLLALGPAATTASAQTEGTFSLGVEGGMKLAPDSAATGSTDFGLLWRFGHPKTGWGWAWGLNWYQTDIDRSVPVGGGVVDFGELHIRPITAGYGYTQVIGRTAITGALQGGFAFTSVSLDAAAEKAYIERLGARSVDADSGMTWVTRPSVGVWHDLNKKFGLHFSAGYTIARPHVTLKSSLGEDERRVRADVFTFKVGLAYSVF